MPTHRECAKKMMAQIKDWLNAVKADSGLPASSTCFEVAYQLTQKINSAEFCKSGVLVTWQAERTIANACGLSERTVRDTLHHLRDAGYLEIKTGHGPGQSNRYTLKNPAAFNEANTGNGLPHSDEQKRQSGVATAADERMKTGGRQPPNYSISNSIISPREPRRAEEALGPLGAELRKRIGADNQEAWFGDGKVWIISQVDDTITLAVRDKFLAQQIRNRFESHILACLPGVVRIEFVVKKRDGRQDVTVTGT
jgi:hypothetical protein